MELELERRVAERTRELEEANEALRQSQHMLAMELEAAQGLQNVATELISARGTQALYDQILDTATAILHADFSSIQQFFPGSGTDGELRLLGHRGFHSEVSTNWKLIRPARCTSCAEAMRIGRRVAVTDIRTCAFMSGTEDSDEYLRVGILAVQSTPLVSRSGALLGMVSTHWSKPHEMTASEGRAMDVLARLAADLIERSLAEDKLSESEERFRNLANAAPVMIWVVGADKRAIFFNKRCLDFTGHSMEDKLGDGWLVTLHAEDRERFLVTYSSSIDARREFSSVFRLRRFDGEYRWVLCTGVPRLGAGGVFSGFIGSCIEITDQKLIEEGLRASEVRLMAAQRLAKVGNWERQLDGEAIHWSEEMLRIIGLPANNAPTNLAAFLGYVHPKDREKVLMVDIKVNSSITPVDTEYRIVRPDGEVCFVRSIVETIRDDGGVPVRINEAIQDITEQVRARELLRDSEEHLKNAERLAHLGHWQWDIRTNRVSGSEEMYRIFGKPPDFIPSYEGFLADLSPPDREEMERLIRDSLTRNIGHSVEYPIALPNGDVRTISCVWEVLQDDEGVAVRIFGTCQDITESRRAQEESFARQKLESVGTLANGIAHDFNNLLGGVLAQAELALSECDARRYPEDELKSIRNVAIRGSEIVRQLMIYAGKETAAVGLVNVSRIVAEMLELLKVSLSKRAVLETDLAPDAPAVLANAAQVRQIVLNLITNASDAIGERDGVIRVTTRSVKAPDCDQLQLEVTDTGHGMSPETQAKVFDPFFTTKSAGRGLGLAVVYGIVRDLGGTILIASEPGRGATFQILLPAARTAAGQTGQATLAPGETTNSFHGATLLIVEDEDMLRRATGKMLRKTGFEVWEAADGHSAIQLLRANGRQIDLILLDMTIPGASSHEVIAEASKVRPDVRVILTSAYSREMIASAMTAPQIRDFIRKPFQLPALVKTLRNTLSS